MKKTTRSRKKPTGRQSIQSELIAFKREKILNAASDLFFEQGYERTTLDMVGERLGVTKPFIYYQFENKAEILVELCLPIMNSVNKALDDVLATDKGSVTERLRNAVIEICVATLENQRRTAIFFREEKQLTSAAITTINKMRKAFDEKLRTLLEEGVRSGEFKIQDPKFCGLAISGVINWSYVWYNPMGPLSKRQIGEHTADLVLQMIGARQAAAAKRQSTGS